MSVNLTQQSNALRMNHKSKLKYESESHKKEFQRVHKTNKSMLFIVKNVLKCLIISKEKYSIPLTDVEIHSFLKSIGQFTQLHFSLI